MRVNHVVFILGPEGQVRSMVRFREIEKLREFFDANVGQPFAIVQEYEPENVVERFALWLARRRG